MQAVAELGDRFPHPGALGLVASTLGRIWEPTFRGFQGYCLEYTVEGPQFEEAKTQILLNHKLFEEYQMIRRKVKTVSLKSLNIPR